MNKKKKKKMEKKRKNHPSQYIINKKNQTAEGENAVCEKCENTREYAGKSCGIYKCKRKMYERNEWKKQNQKET